MNDLKSKYDKAKKKAYAFMQNGQIAAYVQALTEMNSYKNKMKLILAN